MHLYKSVAYQCYILILVHHQGLVEGSSSSSSSSSIGIFLPFQILVYSTILFKPFFLSPYASCSLTAENLF
jgi:hypothetical protein